MVLSKETYNKYICQKKEKHCCQYSKDVHRTKGKALTIARLIHSPYTARTARIII